jgi:ribonuclease P protein component
MTRSNIEGRRLQIKNGRSGSVTLIDLIKEDFEMKAQRNSPAADEQYPKAHRLRTAEDFSTTFSEGLWGSTDVIRVVVRKNLGEPIPRSRFGMAVSKKFGKAHQRNMLKRRIREVIRRTKAELPAGFDCVILPSNRTLNPSYEQILETLPKLIKQTVSRLERKGNKERRKNVRRK